MARESILAGHDVETAKVAVKAANDAETALKAKAEADALAAKAAAEASAKALAEKDKEIARLQFAQQGQGGVGVTPNQGAADRPKANAEPKLVADWEWENDPAVRNGFSTKERYVAYRTAELKGQVKSISRPAA